MNECQLSVLSVKNEWRTYGLQTKVRRIEGGDRDNEAPSTVGRFPSFSFIRHPYRKVRLRTKKKTMEILQKTSPSPEHLPHMHLRTTPAILQASRVDPKMNHLGVRDLEKSPGLA